MKEKRKKSGMSFFFNHGKKSNLLSASNIRYDNDVLLRGVGGGGTYLQYNKREREVVWKEGERVRKGK